MDRDIVYYIALFLALLCGIMAVKQSGLPSLVGQEVMSIMVSNERHRHEGAPTSVGGKRGKIVEEESITGEQEE